MNKEIMEKKVQMVEDGFKPFLPKEDGFQKTVLSAMKYSLLAGGKRLRPIFMYEMYLIFGGTKEAVIRPFMMAVEMIHTYSLVHDDLPAMDNDDYRRGKLTTHKKYGEDMGILAGDALLNAAYETAFLAFSSETGAEHVGTALQILAKKAGIYGMVGGQVVDVENNGHFVDADTLSFVYENKTAALIEASMMVGAVLAGASEDDVRKLEKIGSYIGIAFQIQDDILDIAGDENVLGKPVHSDEKNEKSTYASLYGIEESKKTVRLYTKKGIDLFDSIKTHNETEKEFMRELLLLLVEREK